MRNGAKTAAISAVAVAMIAAGGYGAYSLVGSDGKKSAAGPKTRTVVAEAPSADLAAGGAKDFLDKWAAGDLESASKLTDDPQTALVALSSFRDKVKPSALTLVPGGPATAAAFASAAAGPSSPAGGASPSPAAASPSASASASASAAPANQVLLSYKSKAEFAGTTNTWQYTGYLGMVKMSDGKAAVHWANSVINPRLHDKDTITAQPVFSPATKVVDRNGASLAAYPSLAQILLKFQTAAPTGDPADAGTGVVITDENGKTAPLFTVVDPKPGKPLKLTIDGKLQAAAEKAVSEQYAKGNKKSAMVAIEPSSGHILAVANAPATGYNMAFLGTTAPGSTMKVITAAALLEAGIEPTATMPCPDHVTTGTTYHNDKGLSGDHPDFTFQQDFAQSCNTAFIQQGLKTLQSGQLAQEAQDVFGIGPVWKTGISSADGKVPGPGQSKDETAGEYMGQGKVQMNALAMASVAATVQSGTFKQPILVDGMPQIPATRQLSPDVLTKLRAMMNSVITDPNGTANKAVTGLTGNFGGKTGTAEVGDPNAPTDSWFTGYRDNLAVCATVAAGGFGADAAAPAVAEVLRVGN